MQLSEFLARLSPDERNALVARRLGPEARPLDNHALLGQLTLPLSIHMALAELNNGQLLLLRWLATRPNLTASWSELLEALGARLPDELRDAYLQELRLSGLADFDPK